MLVLVAFMVIWMGLAWSWWGLSFLGLRKGDDRLAVGWWGETGPEVVIVVMCALNGGKYIRDRVEKWVDQCGVDEVDVLTDGSTDDTDEQVWLGGGVVVHCGESRKAEKMRWVATHWAYGEDVVYVFTDQGTEPGSHYCAYRLAYGAWLSEGPVQGQRVGKGGTLLQDFQAVERGSAWAVMQSGRCRMGGSAMLAGSGWAIPANVLRATEFPTFSVTEDLAYTLGLAGSGVAVHFMEDVKVLDDLPTSWRGLWRQRVRWGRGTLQCVFSRLMGRAMVGREWGIGWVVILNQVIGLCIWFLLVRALVVDPMRLVPWVGIMILVGGFFSLAGAIRTRRWRGVFGYIVMWGIATGAFMVAWCSWWVRTWVPTVYRGNEWRKT